MHGLVTPTVKLQEEGGILLPRCRVCNKVPAQGIHGGIRLRKAFICSKCEQEITCIDVGSAKYHILVEKIKIILK
jgi:hypothetical protein